MFEHYDTVQALWCSLKINYQRSKLFATFSKSQIFLLYTDGNESSDDGYDVTTSDDWNEHGTGNIPRHDGTYGNATGLIWKYDIIHSLICRTSKKDFFLKLGWFVIFMWYCMFLFIRAINSSLELLHATDGNQNIQLVVSKLETLSLHILILFSSQWWCSQECLKTWDLQPVFQCKPQEW